MRRAVLGAVGLALAVLAIARADAAPAHRPGYIERILGMEPGQTVRRPAVEDLPAVYERRGGRHKAAAGGARRGVTHEWKGRGGWKTMPKVGHSNGG